MENLFLNLPSRLLFGPESRLRLGTEARRYGERALLITESLFRGTPLLEELTESLDQAGVESISYSELGPDSTSRAGEHCLELAKSGHVEMIIGLGGVRALSLAKAVAALGSTIFDIDNMIDRQHSDAAVYPYIEIPTSCRSPFMLGESFLLTDARNRHTMIIRRWGSQPATVLFDPQSGDGISERGQAASILDTLLHSLEGFFSRGSNFFSASVFLRSIGLAVDYIDAFTRRDEPDIRIKAYQAGLLSAFALTMGSLGIGSAVSIAASGLFQVPRSGIAIVMLPMVLEYGRRACPEKLARMAPIIEEDTRQMNTTSAADLVIGSLRRRIDSFELPLRLSDYGIRRTDLPLLAAMSSAMGLCDEQPVPLSEDELLELLREAL